MLTVSVVIPTFGRHETLARALGRLARQTVAPGAFEVIVVKHPDEPDSERVERTVAAQPYDARSVPRHDPGVASARNSGWREARAPLLLFLDDDVLADRRLVAEHLAWHDRHPEEHVGVLGQVRWARELRITPFMKWVERGMQFDYGNIRGTDAGWGRFYTANVSVKRRLVERVGGFDESFPWGYEDLDLAYRMHSQGFRLLYNRRASAEHLHAMTPEGWEDRMRKVAASERQFVNLHPEIPAYFKDIFASAVDAPPARGRGVHLARFVPPWFPWLGPRVWGSVDTYYRQLLAPSFLEGWREAEHAEQGAYS